MKIKIAGVTIDKWQNLSVSLIYDSVKSVFSFDLWWNPFDATMRSIMLPGYYRRCTIISDSGEVLLTGVMHSPSFEDSAMPCLVNISGYSITGVLDDCEYRALNISSSQTNGKTILQICQLVCNQFGLGLVDNTDGAANETVTQSDVSDIDKSCTEYLSGLAKENNIVLSHDASGNLVLSIAKDTKPLYDFVSGQPGLKLNLSFDGQSMHSTVTAATQGGSAQAVVNSNPYVLADVQTGDLLNQPAGQMNPVSRFSTGYRPAYIIQRDTDAASLDKVANQALAEELRAISMTVQMDGWQLNGKIVKPGNIITVKSPRLYLFNKTKFFIQRVDFTGNEKEALCQLTCVVPEVFNGKTPINIFTYQGNNTNFTDNENPGSALQGGFIGSKIPATDL